MVLRLPSRPAGRGEGVCLGSSDSMTTRVCLATSRTSSRGRGTSSCVLARGLEHVAAHPDEAAAVGSAARAFVAREFSMDRFVTGFAELYEELARARGILPGA